MKRNAFTLIEIMITIAIIGIITAIAVTGFIKARITSQRRACQENQVKIDGAVQNYILDYNLFSVTQTQFAGQEITDPSAALLFGTGSYVRSIPLCPNDGVYTILDDEGPAGESVECSLSGLLPNLHTFPRQ